MKTVDVEEIKSICNFEKGIYYLLLIARRKNNNDLTNGTEIVHRRVIYSEDKIEHYMNELMIIAEYDKKHEYKLYISLNPRNVLKAYCSLKQKMAKWDNELINNPEIEKKIINIDKEWCSCLARNPAKKEWFMLDLDDKSKLSDIHGIIDAHNITYFEEFETKNGYHILFKPCDTRELMEDIKRAEIDCELKRDELLCIGYGNW